MDLNQVTIGTRDFDRSVEFYTRLGLKLIVHSEGRYARFELPSGSSTLSIHIDTDRTRGRIRNGNVNRRQRIAYLVNLDSIGCCTAVVQRQGRESTNIDIVDSRRG